MKKTNKLLKLNNDLELIEISSDDYKNKSKVATRRIEKLNPLLLFIYFIGTSVITMITFNPIILGISFFSSICLNIVLTDFRKTLKSFAFSIPMMILIAVINPLLVHEGETIWFYLFDNPITKEAFFYGLTASVMLASVFYWFKCFGIVMTSDKTVYLFGGIAPRISLTLSMALGFIPKLIKQYQKINIVQKSLGMYTSESIRARIMARFRALSTLIGWSLEQSIDTADSMKARGYGLKGRTSYSLYRWTTLDIILSICFIAAVSFIIFSMALSNKIAFYPTITTVDTSIISITGYLIYFIISFFAMFMEIRENLRWRLLILKI